MAIICGIHKLRLLLFDWSAPWMSDGLGLPSRRHGMYVELFFGQITQKVIVPIDRDK